MTEKRNWAERQIDTAVESGVGTLAVEAFHEVVNVLDRGRRLFVEVVVKSEGRSR